MIQTDVPTDETSKSIKAVSPSTWPLILTIENDRARVPCNITPPAANNEARRTTRRTQRTEEDNEEAEHSKFKFKRASVSRFQIVKHASEFLHNTYCDPLLSPHLLIQRSHGATEPRIYLGTPPSWLCSDATRGYKVCSTRPGVLSGSAQRYE